MNMTELTRRILSNVGVNIISLDGVTDDIERNSGTFRDFYDEWMEGKMKLLTRGGNIVGIEYVSGAASTTEEEIEKMRFMKRYGEGNIYGYVMKTLAVISGESTLEEIEEEDAAKSECAGASGTCDDDNSDTPCCVDITLDRELEENEDAVKVACSELRSRYGRYLAKGTTPVVEVETDENGNTVLKCSEISWGRRK